MYAKSLLEAFCIAINLTLFSKYSSLSSIISTLSIRIYLLFIGNNNYFMNSCTIDHDCTIENIVILSPSAGAGVVLIVTVLAVEFFTY